MDDFIKRPRRPHIDLSKREPVAKPVRRPIIVNSATDIVRKQPLHRLAVRPQLSTATKPPAAKPIIELPSDNPGTPDASITKSAVDAAHPEGDAGLAKAGKPKRRFKLRPHWPHSRKGWIIFIAVLVLILGGGGGAAYWFLIKPDAKPAPVVQAPPKKAETPKPTTEASKLSGLQVPFGVNERAVTAVMIENSPDARPQAGLKEASVIFEAVAEGGITRFAAIYQDTAPDYVGPIRSVRPYYIDWFLPFDASIAHVGGSPQGLADIRALGAKDLDQFANGGYYSRITERYAPHNVYTSIAKLNELEQAKGFTSANFTGFERKKEAKLEIPTAKSIDLAISSFYYNVHYDYDAATNSYLRSVGGAQHRDDRSGTQLAPKVVVAIVMGRGIASDGQHTEYKTVGSGQMYVFQDGAVAAGTWTKDARNSQWKFADAAGAPLPFNPGQTWISIVDNQGAVISTP